MLTNAALRNLKPKSKIYKASDRDVKNFRRSSWSLRAMNLIDIGHAMRSRHRLSKDIDISCLTRSTSVLSHLV